jgi:hypothetical protein
MYPLTKLGITEAEPTPHAKSSPAALCSENPPAPQVATLEAVLLAEKATGILVDAALISTPVSAHAKAEVNSRIKLIRFMYRSFRDVQYAVDVFVVKYHFCPFPNPNMFKTLPMNVGLTTAAISSGISIDSAIILAPI